MEKPNTPQPVPNILLVDDTPANLRLLTGMLKGLGYKVRSVSSGKFALQTARHDPPDLILLDIMMPEMDGYEVCERLKADEQLAAIPVMFLSSLNETTDKVKAFEVGGVDYVTKPFQLREVQARVAIQLELHRQRRLIQENYEQLSRLYESELKAKKDAADAMQTLADQHIQLQQALLPSELPSVPGFRLAARFVAGAEGKIVGGDFYDVFETGNGSLAILIGDVAGKGVDAASLAVTTRSTIRAFAYELSDPCKALAHAGEVIFSENGFGQRFVTVGLAVLDPTTGQFVYASAGHPPAMVLRADGNVELLWAAQLPMGILPKFECTPFISQLAAGDKLVLYTDGISESRFGSSMYGTEGIQATLETRGSFSPERVLTAIFEKAVEFGRGVLVDDAAVVVIERSATHSSS